MTVLYVTGIIVLYSTNFLLGTIVSIQENPFPGPYVPNPEERRAVLSTIRRNVGFIFSGVSKQHSIVSANDSLVTIRVRHFSNSQPDDSSISQEDGSSLLFYYIFDDWVTSYRLVARREHKYGAYLDDLVGYISRLEHMHRPNRSLERTDARQAGCGAS